MGHRRSASGRNSTYTHSRRGTHIGSQLSSPHHRPLSHSSPVRELGKPPRKVFWGSGGNRSHFNGNDDRPSPHHCFSRDTGSATWSENFTRLNRSPLSLNHSSDGGSTISNTIGAAHSKCSNNISNKKPVPRPSNPLRYKTELCRSFEESGECRFGSSCTFAHGLRELRAVLRHPRYKTDLCRTYHGAGYCQYGARCHFVHDPEEASGVSAMRGHRLRPCVDGASMGMFTLPENTNASSACSSDWILANLQRLHAYKLMEEKFGFLNSSGYSSDQLDSIGTLSPDSNSMSFDMLTIGQDNLLGIAPNSQTVENACGSALDIPDAGTAKYFIDTESPERGDKIGRLPPLGATLWEKEHELNNTLSSVSDLNALTFVPDMWSPCGLSAERKSVVGNPMEVSRNLLIPTISELIHMP